MHGFVKAERFARRQLRAYGGKIPAEARAWAEGVIAYCRADHDAACADHRAGFRKAKARALVSRLESVCDAVCGIHAHSRPVKNG